MKICAPIAHIRELEPLARSGAGELYCGVTPRAWVERFGAAVWANRRGPLGGNILEVRGLALIAQEAHRLGLPVSLTLNAPCHIPAQWEVLRPLVREAVEEIAVDSLIIADPAILLAVRDLYPRIPIAVSSVSVAGNREALSFFRDLGARRIILPRHLSLGEMASLVASAPDLEFEAFVLNDGCAFEEGLCHTQHGAGGLPAFCCHDWERRAVPRSGKRPSREEEGLWRHHFRDHAEWLRLLGGRGSALNEKGIPTGHCGLCALADLQKIGIRALKIAGREAGTLRKIRSVQLVRAVLERIGPRPSRSRAREAAVALRGDPEACAAGLLCYYPEAGAVRAHPRQGVPRGPRTTR